jgi:hypothetical protein
MSLNLFQIPEHMFSLELVVFRASADTIIITKGLKSLCLKLNINFIYYNIKKGTRILYFCL